MNIKNFDLNAIGPDFIENPFPVLKELREQSPVHRNPDGSLYLTRYHDVKAVYQSKHMSSDKQEAFGQKFGSEPLYTHHTTSLIFNDPPYHTIVRKLLSAAFTPRKLAEMEPLIENIIDGLLDKLEDKGEFDFISEYAGDRLATEIERVFMYRPANIRCLELYAVVRQNTTPLGVDE